MGNSSGGSGGSNHNVNNNDNKNGNYTNNVKVVKMHLARYFFTANWGNKNMALLTFAFFLKFNLPHNNDILLVVKCPCQAIFLQFQQCKLAK